MKLEGLKILITGGAGFVGSHLADKLLERHNLVTCYDNFNQYYSGKERNTEKSQNNPNYRLVRANILDPQPLCEAMDDIDVVFHLAAQAGVRYSIDHPMEVSQINVDGTINVLEAARQRGVSKIIYASSSSVYGTPEYMPVSEEHPLDPISPYGLSKVAGEKYCRLYVKLYGMHMRRGDDCVGARWDIK